MDYKEAIGVIFKMLKKHKFSKEEKTALMKAVGTLDWGALARNRMTRIIKSRQNKNKN